ncbi:translationally-controlled tumor protein homolog [Eurytemora carolleeae]|uniref:translationally-controlled tumor protein homolog n=1 Tax=Eurytemora carolleeae TaxID=1294199 RepID=UPI000C77B81B|nr:translationally-controlled tumor protein homolog [Eurytemora carolleeae]|eukprot:XP_023337417.1 translationally-controlled tumor protein homolog [Eurytemora affinis]
MVQGGEWEEDREVRCRKELRIRMQLREESGEVRFWIKSRKVGGEVRFGMKCREEDGEHITRTEGDIQLEGSNASAEEMDEGVDSNSVSGIDHIVSHRLVETDLILNHRLVETGFGNKNDYMVYLKDYMKKVVKYLETHDRAGEVDTFKKNINGVMKGLLSKFKDLQFFQGESMDPTAMILILDYKEIDGEERPVLLAFKHGLEEEKC